MLAELVVSDLGVLDGLSLVFDPGMTALTGETGAGKTMVVGAIGLLAGDRADPGVVRPGAAEATVEGRFLIDDEELVLTRVVPRSGRSRAYRNGRAVTPCPRRVRRGRPGCAGGRASGGAGHRAGARRARR
jgi:DNA repair protein RecN (Recombination protein N)